MELYELGKREPVASIDSLGQLWCYPTENFDVNQVTGPIKARPSLPKILFADVPVVIHTAFYFSIAPMNEANADTGPEPITTKEIRAKEITAKEIRANTITAPEIKGQGPNDIACDYCGFSDCKGDCGD